MFAYIRFDLTAANIYNMCLTLPNLFGKYGKYVRTLINREQATLFIVLYARDFEITSMRKI